MKPNWDMLKDDPLRILDVGAAAGIQKNWMPFLQYCRVTALEPNPIECARLNREQGYQNVVYIPQGLSNETSMQKFYITENEDCSSIFEPNPAYNAYWPPHTFKVKECLFFDCCTYSEFRRRYALQAQHVIKLDTQGSERLILDTLNLADWESLLAVQVEVSFVPLYKQQPLFCEIHSMLEGRGFTLITLRPGTWLHRGGYVAGVRHPVSPFLQGDAFYMRLKCGQTFGCMQDLLRYLLVCRMYGFEDEARHVAAGANLELEWSPYTTFEAMMIFIKRFVPGATALRSLARR